MVLSLCGMILFPNTSHVPKVLGLGCGSSRFTSLPIPMGKETFEFQMKHFFKRDQIVRAIAPNFSLVEMSDFPQNGNPRNIQSFEKKCPSSDPIVPHFSHFFYGQTMGLSPSPGAGNPRKQFRVERLSGSDGGNFAGRNHGDVKNMVLSRKMNDIG